MVESLSQLRRTLGRPNSGAAGAIIIGKTNLSEWANIRAQIYSISGWSAIGGQTHNPWALDRNAGGSSSGSAAAVAAGLVAHGNRNPDRRFGHLPRTGSTASVGSKPTVGLISRTYIVPISHSQDTAGPMAASVREAAELLTVIAGSDPKDPATRDADKYKRDYASSLDVNSLKGKRIGVLRFASSKTLDGALTPRSQSSVKRRNSGRHQGVRPESDRQE